MILSSISQSLYDFSEPDFHHMHLSNLLLCHASQSLLENLQAYNIEGTVQQEKEHKFQAAGRALGIV